MAGDMTSVGGARGEFPLTRWSLIQRANAPEAEARSAAMEELSQAYWRPLYCFAFLRGAPNVEAQDLTQGFFLSLLERDLLARFDPKQGRFRTWLLACFVNHCRGQRDRGEAVKRGGRLRAVSVDDVERGDWSRLRDRGVTPEQAYDRAWALEKMGRAVQQVREILRTEVDASAIIVLEGYLKADNVARPNYHGLAGASGLSETAVRHTLERLRRLLREAILAEIRTETAGEAEAEAELGLLLQCLGS